MSDDYERFSEKEVLEMIKSEQKKVWNTCVLLSLMNEGLIDETSFWMKYVSLNRDLCDDLFEKLYRFKRDRRKWAKKFKA